MLGAVDEEPCCAFEFLASNGQLDLRRLLNVSHPLAVHVRGADVEPVTVQNKPDRDFVRLPSLASIMGQGCGLLASYSFESRKCARFHKLPFRKLQENHQKLNVPELLLSHAEIMTQFVYKRLADLMSDFGLIGADRFDVLLIKHDVGRTSR